jgi:hypothetical protein
MPKFDASRRGATALEISASHEGVERYMKNAQDGVPALAFIELNERWGDHLPGNPAAYAERQIDGSGWLPAPIQIAANDDQANNTLPVAAEQSPALGRAVLPARPARLFRIEEDMTAPLTRNQNVAVTGYALADGENLKDRLAADWRDGRSEGELQRSRNSHGPAWLAIYSLADWPKRMFSVGARLDPQPDCAMEAAECRLLIHAYGKNPERLRRRARRARQGIRGVDLPADFPQRMGA